MCGLGSVITRRLRVDVVVVVVAVVVGVEGQRVYNERVD